LKEREGEKEENVQEQKQIGEVNTKEKIENTKKMKMNGMKKERECV